MLRTGMMAACAILLAGSAFAAAPPAGTAPPAQSGGNATLSTKLAQSNGTIQPPQGTDEGMALKPKQNGAMPVITPRQKNGPNVVAK